MSKKARKGAKARERAGNPELSDLVGREKVEKLLKTFNSSDVDSFVDGMLESGNLYLMKHARALESSDHLADMKIERSIEETMKKIATGEFNDPDKWEYGDGVQTPVKFPGSQKLRTLWGE